MKKERVKVGSVSVPFWLHAEGWRWAWKDADGKWRHGTRRSREDAIDAARARCRSIASGKLDLDAITATQADLARQFLAMNPTADDLRKLAAWKSESAITLPTVIDKWSASKLAEIHGKETPHLRNVRQWLEKLEEALPIALILSQMRSARCFLKFGMGGYNNVLSEESFPGFTNTKK